jgi:alpha-tubulin suppressor-like RCC1 family protein
MEELHQWLSSAVANVVVAGGEHSFLLLETGEVYASGSNDHGQLGLGDTQNRHAWQRVAVPGLVRTVVAGGKHSFLHLVTGEVYACGHNLHGQLGLGGNQDRNGWRRVVVPFRRGSLRAVVAGGLHSFLSLETGEVYACGYNYLGQLGLGDAQNRGPSCKWQQVAVPGVVRMMAAGCFHSLLLETGEVYSCGFNNNSGQLGLGDFRNRSSFCKGERAAVPFTRGVVRTVVAGGGPVLPPVGSRRSVRLR